MRPRIVTILRGACISGALVALLAAPASAQEDSLGQVDISFDVGEFDPVIDDWAIETVVVSGALADGQPFTVELVDEDGLVLWSSTQTYAEPMRIAVDRTVAVGDVAEAGVSQPQVVVAGVQVIRPEVTWSAGGGGGSGQLSLSMVLAIVVVAIVFRTPLPSVSTERWTR